jgi:nucleotide-binding universal stress UspA family protein
MLGTVLVPLDGSGFAEAALPIAKQLVGRAGARLHLTIADQPSPVQVGAGEITSALDVLGEECRLEDESYLVRTAAMLGSVGEGSVRVSLLEGPVGQAICEEAGRIGADLIVMSTHARNGVGRALLGSVADYVVRHAARPVLLVRPLEPRTPRTDRPVRNILVPLDPSDYSEAILESVLTLVRVLRARLTLATIVAPRFGIAEPELPPPTPQHPAIVARRSDEAHARLDKLAGLYGRLGIDVRTRVAVAGTPAEGILDLLAEERFDMVALATHGAAGIRRILAGSVAAKVIRESRKPVLVYHPIVP